MCQPYRPSAHHHVAARRAALVLLGAGERIGVEGCREAADLTPPLPAQAVSVRKHLDKFRGDTDAKFRLILIESRIHRVTRYYKSVKAVPPNFKYESATASTLVS
jgi:ribosomal protein S15P/S13E